MIKKKLHIVGKGNGKRRSKGRGRPSQGARTSKALIAILSNTEVSYEEKENAVIVYSHSMDKIELHFIVKEIIGIDPSEPTIIERGGSSLGGSTATFSMISLGKTMSKLAREELADDDWTPNSGISYPARYPHDWAIAHVIRLLNELFTGAYS